MKKQRLLFRSALFTLAFLLGILSIPFVATAQTTTHGPRKSGTEVYAGTRSRTDTGYKTTSKGPDRHLETAKTTDRSGNGRQVETARTPEKQPNDRTNVDRKYDNRGPGNGRGNPGNHTNGYGDKRDDRKAENRGGHGRYDNDRGHGNEGHSRAPNWDYDRMPRRGACVDHYPVRSQVIHYRGTPYYYSDGVYYSSYEGRYRVVRAPIGMRVRVIPAGFRTIWVHRRPYYYYYGTYYERRGDYYETIDAPIGSLVESIPDGYEKLYIDGDTYYIVDGVQYKAVLYDGEIWYEVIKTGL